MSSSTPPASTSDPAVLTSSRRTTPDSTTYSDIPEDWQGWAELENDPAIFSTLLREWGIPSIEVQEVFDLDSLVQSVATDVLGLIFLARWTKPETTNDLSQAPDGLWFANQVSSYSCASLAIMNIINNQPNVDLGPELNVFRQSTISMSPKERGVALDSFRWVRDKHNSFATEIDKLNVDKSLRVDALEWEKKKRAEEGAVTSSRRKRRKISMHDELSENGFHFTAYAPCNGAVWKMDGMEPLPRELQVTHEADWLFAAVDDLRSLTQAAGADGFEFSLLSLVRKTEDAVVGNDGEMEHAREDWGPFLAHMIKLHAEKGDIKELMGQ